MHLVQLDGFEAHALRDAERRRGAVRVARQRVVRHAHAAAHEVHLHRRRVVLQGQQPLPHHRVTLREQKHFTSRVRLRIHAGCQPHKTYFLSIEYNHMDNNIYFIFFLESLS